MTFFHSIRTKLTIWYAAWSAATLIGSGIIGYFVIRETLDSNLDRSLRTEIKWVNDFIEPTARKIKLKKSAILELNKLKQEATTSDESTDEDSTPEEQQQVDAMWNQIYQHTLLSPRRHFIQIVDRNGQLLYRSPSLGKQEIQFADSLIPYARIAITTITGSDKKDLRLAITQNDHVKIYVAYPLEPVNEVLDNLFSSIRLLVPLTLLISVIGGWFLAHKSLRPVDAVTRAAREITAQNLNKRLPTQHVDDEINRLTGQFNDMISRLQASFAQIQQFSADASHELRTPLTIMRGEIEVALRKSNLRKPSRTLLQSIHDELVRLSSIVDSLMTLVNSDSGRLVFNLEPVSLSPMIKELSEDARLLAKPKNISVRLGRCEDVTVSGDATRLKQLFLNLIDNAVKYTPARGKIALSLERSDGSALISIRDSGIGIPRKFQAKVFERFYRVERAHGTSVQGSGLGLSIAKWIAEVHHGSIEVKSRENKGSTFIVRIPVALSESPHRAFS
ncbi:MAG TPA: ATP-binding protein [Bacteroidota bacterium]|nr:ATP-binding protein [Bacteroidota bacterium]